MAILTSLGIHTPSALHYCIAENLLSDPPSASSYQWNLTPSVPDEELLVTGSAVIWSQGGVIRRVFRFDVEKEPVVQATFAWFSTDDAVKNAKAEEKRRANKEAAEKKKKKRQSTWNSKSRSYALQLGTFPRNKPGLAKKTSMNAKDDEDEDENEEEEEEDGQGRLEKENGRRRALVVFLKDQAQIFYLSGTSYVIHLPFEIQYALAAPNGVLIQRKLPIGGIPAVAKEFPRLFSLTDPLLEVGLVISQEGGGSLNSQEEIIFISNPNHEQAEDANHFSAVSKKLDFLFAVTRNVEKGSITIWHAKYILQESVSSAHGKRTPSASGTATRRRSSFGPGTGATTPVAPNVSMISAEESIQLDFDKEKTSNRRVSSLVARADLSGTMDRMAFNDLASASSSFLQPPVDDLLDELNSGSGLGFGSMGLYDGEGLRNEILLTKIESFPTAGLSGELAPNTIPRVFTMSIPTSSTASLSDGRRLLLCIVNHYDSTVLQLSFQLPGPLSLATASFSRKKSSRFATLFNVHRYSALDAIKLSDGAVSRILLTTAKHGLVLEAPWSPPITISMPTLTRADLHQVGQRQYQKRDFARALSSTPKLIHRLEHSEDSGRVTIADEIGTYHRLSFEISPREHAVRQALETVKYVLPDDRGGEATAVAWLNILQKKVGMTSWESSKENRLEEWKGFVIAVFALGVAYLPPQSRRVNPKRDTAQKPRISGGVTAAWEEFVGEDDDVGPQAEYLRSSAWEWLGEEQEERDEAMRPPVVQFSALGSGTTTVKNRFFTRCIASAKLFISTKDGQAIEPYLPHASKDPEIRRTSFAMLLVGLHLLREEWKLDVSMEAAVRKMAGVLVQMSLWLGWRGWVDGYLAEDVEVESWDFEDSQLQAINIPEPQFKQPSIYDWLIDCLESKQMVPFLTIHDIISPNNVSSNQTKLPYVKLTLRTRIITEMYTLLMDKEKSYIDVVARMDKMKVNMAMLEKFPEGVAIPLWEAISRSQENPPTTWGESALDLVGRKDLKMLIKNVGRQKRDFTKYTTVPSHEAIRDVHSVTASTHEPELLGAFDGNAEIDRTIITKLIFAEDRRMAEAARLLQSTRPIAVKSIPEPEWTEHETLENQQVLSAHVALRTLAVPAGRGLLFFSARIPLLTEKFPTPGFNLTCLMKPSNTTVSADKGNYTEEKVCWAFFHAGVSAGLSISKEADEIDTSWIVYNKPTDLSNRHAGFLLALGLNGHLKSIAKWHAFNYLTPKHTMTSIGLLLGLSASYLGTMDTTITKLLSVHVTRLLPPGSAELNLSGLTQTAGIMGIGLLYYNTQHRRMSEVMLSEVEHVDVKDASVPEDTLRDEGYRLAAGFSLGFINLGAGKDLMGLHDMRLVERLIDLAAGSKNVAVVHVLDKATAGATIALALIYMKSMDESLAKKIDIPDTIHMFDYIRPDLFLLRTVAKHLILWDNIKPSMDWVRGGFRPFLQTQWKLDRIVLLDSSYLPLLNLAAGLCFSIALRFAGSGETEARDTLLCYLDQFTRLCNLPANNHDQKLTRATARNCQDLLALSAATVMAGSGDLNVFRRLRRHHGKVDAEVPFGSHLASHLAIGILFMAGGTFTFGTSNLAVGSLLLSLYPLFPNGILDNRNHLQAFRHFWVMAAEPRCLVVRDVDTNRPTSVPVTITLTNGTELKRTAPCLLPELENVASVRTESAEYWTAVLDFANNKEHLAAFKRSQTMYIQPRPPQFLPSSLYASTLKGLENQETVAATNFEWLLRLNVFANSLDSAERGILLPNVRDMGNMNGEETSVDAKMVLEKNNLHGWNADRLRGLKVLFAFVDGRRNGEGVRCLTEESVERLRAAVWTSFT